MEENKKISEILEYLEKCELEYVSKEEFISHLEVYDLADILDAQAIWKERATNV